MNVHFEPEPHARARMGCWSTLSSYLRFFPSRVVRVVKLCVSLGTTVKLGLCSMTGYKARLELGSVDGARIEATAEG